MPVLRLLKGNGGLPDTTGQATLGLYALFADVAVELADAGLRDRV